MNSVELKMRTRNMNHEYEMRFVPEYGAGMWPVHKGTGEVCDCDMEWDEAGEVLSCPVCGLDGT